MLRRKQVFLISFLAVLIIAGLIVSMAVAGPRLTAQQKRCLSSWDKAVAGLKASKWGIASIDEVKSMIDAEVPIFILDVRMTKDRDKDGAIAGSTHIPITELAEKIDLLPDDTNSLIIVHCKSGWTGVMAMTILRQLGYDNCKNMKGGFMAWAKAGYPIEK